MFSISTRFHKPSIHPLFIFTLGLMSGIWFASTQNIYIALINFSILSVVSLFMHYKKRYMILIALSGFFCGWFNHKTQTITYVNLKNVLSGKKLTIIGTVYDIQQTDNTRHKKCIYLKTNVIQPINESCQQVNANIALYTNSFSNVTVDDTIKITSAKCALSSDQSFNDYLMKEHIHATIFDKSFSYTIVNHPQYSLKRLIVEYKESIKSSLLKKMNNKTRLFFSSLFLGNNQNKTFVRYLKQDFTHWGIVHVLARSGLHLVMFIIIWSLLFSFLPIPLSYKEIMLLFFVCIYALFSWTSLSFMRALCMFIIYKLYTLLKIPTHSFHIITLICCIALLYNPHILFFPDFQLSFGLTAALSWLYHIQIYKKQMVTSH